MKANRLAVAIAAVLSLAAAAPVLAAESHSHHGHQAEGPARLSLDNGRKWATDDALRRGMADIRAAIEARQPAAKGGTLPAAEYRAIGETMDEKIGFIVANCKLSPAADANLHIVLGELLGASDALRNGSDGAKALDRAVAALDAYGRHFEHPGWKAVASASAPMPPLKLSEAVRVIETSYPGRTIAAEFDPNGGQAMHYHVDLMLPHGKVAKFEVDAATQRISNRLPPE